MSKVLLTLGYDSFLLPDDKGIMTVIKALSRAVPVHHTSRWNSGNKLVVRDRSLTVQMAYVAPGTIIEFPEEGESETERAERAVLRLTEPKSIIIPREE